MDKKDKEILEFWRNKGVDILEEIPQGWKVRKGTLTEPNGYVWIFNGKGILEKDSKGNRLFKSALTKVQEICIKKTLTS